MIISYKYRLYPSKAQTTRLNETLETCRQVYNWILSDREEEYKITKKSPTVFTQQRRIKVFRETWKELQLVYSQVLQNVVVRVDKAYQGFFRRLKKGDKPGYPRYKGRGWYDSFTYPQSGFSIEDKKLKLSKVGSVKIKLHRFPEGIIKTCNIRRHNNKWYACFTCKTESKPLPTTGKSIGIDVGLEKFAALSNGDFIENPRFFRAEEKQLAKAQKRFSKNKTKRTRRVVTHIHERIANKRHNFIHQLSRKIINEYDIIAVEKLNVTNMVKNHNLAKSISDASWTMFRYALTYKAESANRKLIEVKPAYTSQDCSGCGYRAKKPLKERWHNCPICGLSLDRDTNAAINILALGLQSLTG